MSPRSKVISFAAARSVQVFRFAVEIMSGPVTSAFMQRNPDPPSRIIDTKGVNTLEELHWAIFKAFNREEAHCYAFQLGGKKPMDRKATVYSIDACNDDMHTQNAEKTRIETLPLRVGQSMFYWFDFGDDWWHEVKLISNETVPTTKIRYPCVVECKGESPPQYPDWDEDETCADDTGSLVVSAGQQERYDRIRMMIMDFCNKKLDEEYARVCNLLFAEGIKAGLMRDRCKLESWAAAFVHAAGLINFLYDSTANPHLQAGDIATHFCISSSTMSTKGRDVLDILGTFPLDPRYCTAARLEGNPLVPLIDMGLFGQGPKRKF